MSPLSQRRTIHEAYLGAIATYNQLEFGQLDHDAGSLVQTRRACRLASAILELERLSALYKASLLYKSSVPYRGWVNTHLSVSAGARYGDSLVAQLKCFCDEGYALLGRQLHA